MSTKNPLTYVGRVTPRRKRQAPSRRFKIAILSTFIAGMVIALFLGLSFFTPVRDYFRSLSYQPSEFSSALASRLSLTDSADLIFRAAHPTFIDSHFSDYCGESDPDSAILGCYTGGDIYVLKIDSDDLPGITESTTAHELLHAIWERLSGSEQTALLADLNQVYSAHLSDLSIIDSYPSSAQASELYARVGTEIADLPSSLETHYAQYFTDRSAIVAFYQDYAAVFSELSSALQTLETEIESLETSISDLTSTYESSSAAFSAAVDEFNACAATPDCFTSYTEFYGRRADLLSEQDYLGTLYSQLSSQIDRYNQLVDDYNSNLIREKDLTTIINLKQENQYEISD